jgi:hypothetical protein
VRGRHDPGPHRTFDCEIVEILVLRHEVAVLRRQEVVEVGDLGPLGRFGALRLIVEGGEFGTRQTRIPQPVGETVTIRYTLRDLLDRLDQLTGQHRGQPEGEHG